MEKKIEVKMDNYNSRRWGKPWIANVEIVNGKLNYIWGRWVGTDHDGGLLILQANSKIWAYGQKDHRRNGTFIAYYKTDTGEEVTKAEAYKILQS